MKITLDYCRGSNEGHAIYLSDENGGYRIAGPKCWGIIKTIASFEMNKSDLEELIVEAKKAIEKLP